MTSDDLPIVAERWQFGRRLQRDGVTAASADEATVDTAAPEGEESAAAGEGDAEADSTEEDDAEEQIPLQPPEPVDSGLPQPIATDGVSTTRGNELFSSRWVIPWVTMSGDSTLLAVSAIQEASVEVSILSGGELIGPIRATVPAVGRTIIPVSVPDGGAAVQVSSTSPVSVEAMVVIPGDRLDVVPGIPTVPTVEG